MNDPHEVATVPSYEIGVMREPSAVLAEAKKAAQALMTVVSQKSKPVIMNGEQYLEFEDWQTVAKFYGLTAKVVRTTFIDLGGVKGYEATAETIRVSDGIAISSADSMCLNDEDKWSTRPKYEYQDVLDGEGKKIWIPAKGEKKGYYKADKVKVGDVPVPLFQLRSMAQTRACAKALRNVLAWVVVLAGFKPTVVEELTGDEEFTEAKTEAAGKPAVAMPQEKQTEAQTNAAPQSKAKNPISEPQGKRLFAIRKSVNYPDKDFQEWLMFNHNTDDRNIERETYDAIVAHVQGYKSNV